MTWSNNLYSLSGSKQGLNAPASFGENWGSNTGNPAFINPYTAGQGINPQGASLLTAVLFWIICRDTLLQLWGHLQHLKVFGEV
jgi:hypothetical protein